MEGAQERIKCIGCNQYVNEPFIKEHIAQCQNYEGVAYRRIQHIYRNLSISNLKLLRSELELCHSLVSDALESRESDKPLSSLFVARQSSLLNSYPQLNLVSHLDDDKVECTQCGKQFSSSYDITSLFYVEECWHLFCVGCVWKHINEKFIDLAGALSCFSKNCNKVIKEHQLRKIMGDKYDEMQLKALEKIANIVECVNCKSKFQYEPGNVAEVPKKDENNQPLLQRHREHYAENRFTCQIPDCKTQQCKQCKVSPYHVGKTCEEYKKHSEMKKCRYCQTPLNQKSRIKSSQRAFEDICHAKECQELMKTACNKILECGHPCGGVLGEAECLPCLHEDCGSNPRLNGQSGSDYCNICYVEALSESPSIMGRCGHIMHEKCLKKRYEVRWLTPRILFNFCLCPLCKNWLQFPEEHYFNKISLDYADLYMRIEGMAVKRLKFEELMKDEKLTNPESPYYQKPEIYSMAIYAYFECFKCKKPYFGGRKNCADAMNEGNNAGQFNAKELICPNCCEIPIDFCPKHGSDQIEFKCKFCCSVAQWFCWGTTHFCDACHRRQSKGDYLTKVPVNRLPKCKGVGKCPIGGNHGSNGYEKSLGCALCRNYVQNHKDF